MLPQMATFFCLLFIRFKHINKIKKERFNMICYNNATDNKKNRNKKANLFLFLYKFLYNFIIDYFNIIKF